MTAYLGEPDTRLKWPGTNGNNIRTPYGWKVAAWDRVNAQLDLAIYNVFTSG